MRRNEPMFTTNEAAGMLALTPGRVRQLVVAGDIKAELRGHTLLIPRSEIEKAKKRKTKPGPAPAKKSAKKGAK